MRAIVLGLVLANLPSSVNASSEPSSIPNIVLIIADDLGTEMLRPYGIGKDLARTPNLDALAARSVLFRNAWSSPVCSPTRACIQTGRFGLRTGIGITVKERINFNGLSASEIILPEMLDTGTNRAYSHALFGKWHLNHATKADLSGAPIGPDVVRIQGYGHHEGVIHNIVAPDSYFDWPKVSNGVAGRSTTYATTDTVNDFLAWHSSVTGPFFAVVAFNAPHSPLHVPPPMLHNEDLTFAGTIKMDPRPYYKAMVEAMDTELGRLLSKLSSTSPNTTIIFMGDNGTPEKIISKDPFKILASDHSKGSTYEGGVNVPLYISGSQVMAPGTDCFAPVHAVDIFATVAELAGVDLKDQAVYPANRTLDSRSLVPFLGGNRSRDSGSRFRAFYRYVYRWRKQNRTRSVQDARPC